MKKSTRLYLCPLISLLFLFMLGCSGSSDHASLPVSSGNPVSSFKKTGLLKPASSISNAKIPSGYAAHKIVFPVNQKGKTKANADVFEIKPFSLDFVLPKNWTLQEKKPQSETKNQTHYLYNGLYSIMYVMSGKKCVGAIGYNTYEPYKGAEDLPSAIYSEIDLGSGYHFNTHEAYKPVKTAGSVTTAITNVDYSANFMAGFGLARTEKINWGILSHDKKLLVYVAAEFDKTAVSKNQINTIANRFQIS
jgi:hypothetical protein